MPIQIRSKASESCCVKCAVHGVAQQVQLQQPKLLQLTLDFSSVLIWLMPVMQCPRFVLERPEAIF